MNPKFNTKNKNMNTVLKAIIWTIIIVLVVWLGYELLQPTQTVSNGAAVEQSITTTNGIPANQTQTTTTPAPTYTTPDPNAKG